MEVPLHTTSLTQGFFRIIKYQGEGGGRGCKTPSPPPPPPFQFCKSSVLWFVTVHTYWGSPLHRGDQICCLPPSPCSRLFPPSIKQSIGGLRLCHFQNFCFFFFFIFSFLSVKQRCLQVWCQGRPRGSLAGCGGPRGRLGTRESRRARQRPFSCHFQCFERCSCSEGSPEAFHQL